jgi:hypothetical protein
MVVAGLPPLGRYGWGGHVNVCSLHELVANWKFGEMVHCRVMHFVGEGLCWVDACFVAVIGVGLLFDMRESRPTLLRFDSLG